MQFKPNEVIIQTQCDKELRNESFKPGLYDLYEDYEIIILSVSIRSRENSYIVFNIPVIAAQTRKFFTYSIVSECKGKVMILCISDNSLTQEKYCVSVWR